MTETRDIASTDIDQFRAEARAWIEANLERRPPAVDGEPARRQDISIARALQRKLYDGGYAGLTYPVEYGGRGLTAAHERAFREEAADYVTPELQIFDPLRIHRSPSRTARVRMPARSDPASGSE